MRWSLVLLAGGVFMLASGGPVLGTDDMTSHRCAEIADPAQRLTCYDAAFKPRTTRPQTAPAVATAPAPKASVPPVQTEFGFTDAQVREQTKEPALADSAPQEIRATVSTLERRRTGEFIAVLDNGQKWVQVELNSQARIKLGDTVIVRRAAFGSYLLITPHGIGTRVRRSQ